MQRARGLWTQKVRGLWPVDAEGARSVDAEGARSVACGCRGRAVCGLLDEEGARSVACGRRGRAVCGRRGCVACGCRGRAVCGPWRYGAACRPETQCTRSETFRIRCVLRGLGMGSWGAERARCTQGVQSRRQ
ncbi:hypothetical protein NDU88_000342 [Pleurodeles waltl]|uniref:Uncharacterized protein n=1 Tax=Pleurodeles waltl TaxID=8319 RepID=A0AAV7M255_PLEWA|nr:hypothetical protein NDU88_000342 [Pleurodeles waltl]